MGVDNPEIWDMWEKAVEKARLKKDVSSLKDGEIILLDDGPQIDDNDIGIDNKRELYIYREKEWESFKNI